MALVLTAFVLAYFSLQRASSAERSATNDEPLHLAAGYAALRYGDYRFDPTHPPLLRMLAASALVGRMTHPLDTSGIETMGFEEWMGRSFQVSSDFIYGESEANALLEAARFRTMLIGALLGLLIFAWAVGVPAGSRLLALKPAVERRGRIVPVQLAVRDSWGLKIRWMGRTFISVESIQGGYYPGGSDETATLGR